MSDVRQDTVAVLEHVADRLAAASLPGDPAEEVRRLARDIYQPCVVAVVGRVKSGKSTLLNVLLGENKAVVGTTETTATINYFAYGHPDPARPVRCHWRGNGRVTEEDEEFLASLQGYDIETLKRADGIESLEYLMPHPWLQRVSLVDTPGLNAVVAEHEDRAMEFLRLRDELRSRHEAETHRLHNKADAIIYVVGPVALADDRDLLEEFRTATGGTSSARNALGVMAKVDLDDRLLARREELAAKIARQLAQQLNTVVPVSAGLALAAQELAGPARDSLADLRSMLIGLPEDALDTLLADEEIFCELDIDGCPVPATHRRSLRTALNWQWSVFATVARLAAEPALSDTQVIERVADLGGFGSLREVLQRHFLERAEIIRCFRLVGDAHRLIESIRFEHIPRLRRETAGSRERLERFVRFVETADGDRAVAQQLSDYLRRRMTPFQRIEELETLWRELDQELSSLLHRLGAHNADFEALQCLEGHLDAFSTEEVQELRALFGLYGTEPSRRAQADGVHGCAQRQLAWRRVSDRTPRGTPRNVVSARACAALGELIAELTSAGRAVATTDAESEALGAQLHTNTVATAN